MRSTMWPERHRGAAEARRTTSVHRLGWAADQQAPAPQFPLEFTGQAIGDPSAAEMAKQGHATQSDGEADQQLQSEFQHAGALRSGQPRGRLLPRRATGRHAGTRSGVPMAPDDPLPSLDVADLEILLAALDPRLDGFGEGESCLDDALAYLARLGIDPEPVGGEGSAAALPPLIRWVEGWRAAGGDRRTLRLMVATLLAQAEGGAEAGSEAGSEVGIAGESAGAGV